MKRDRAMDRRKGEQPEGEKRDRRAKPRDNNTKIGKLEDLAHKVMRKHEKS